MPFWDRDIDMVVISHPDADHSAGLLKVLERYSVRTVLQSGVDSNTSSMRRLQERIDSLVEYDLIAERGQVFDFGDGIIITILFSIRLSFFFSTFAFLNIQINDTIFPSPYGQ